MIAAVRESLKAGGELSRMKAEMCTEVIKLLDNLNKGNKAKLPKQSQDIILLNELIREYLDWMGYKYSSTVFTSGITSCQQVLYCLICNRVYYKNGVRIFRV